MWIDGLFKTVDWVGNDIFMSGSGSADCLVLPVWHASADGAGRDLG